MKPAKGSSLPSYEALSTTVTRAARELWASPAVQTIVDTLLPFPCLACEDAPAQPPLGLCRGCRSQVRASSGLRCWRCGISLERSAGRRARQCGECLSRPGPIDRLWWLYEYRSPLDRVVHSFKFGRLQGLGATFARLAHDRFAEELVAFDAVLPIPLHWRRRWRRGFNQARAIAGPLSRSLGISLIDPLYHRQGKPQSQLDHRQRLRQASRLLGLRPRQRLSGRQLLVVDDVTTTGATLAVAASLLRRAGATTVGALVLARTPRRPRLGMCHDRELF